MTGMLGSDFEMVKITFVMFKNDCQTCHQSIIDLIIKNHFSCNESCLQKCKTDRLNDYIKTPLINYL